jgi:ribonuclease P protein component
MISKLHRFHGHGSLNFVYRKGRVIRGEYASMRIIRSRHDDYRASIVVSKKVSKSAVVRNRIRRRIYEIIRLERKAAGKPWPYDIVISVSDVEAAAAPVEDLRGAMRKMLEKAAL